MKMTNEQIIEKYRGCVIESIKQTDDNCVVVMFENGKGLEFLDDGQRCYERRYMTIDDNLDEYAGATFNSFDVVDAPEIEDDGEVHEVQFLRIHTSFGDLSIANHNEHNGYYGGFYVVCKEIHSHL